MALDDAEMEATLVLTAWTKPSPEAVEIAMAQTCASVA